ncbi:MAG: 50S ribosomal protein L18 [Candidatus Woesearchaeota archaeon]
MAKSKYGKTRTVPYRRKMEGLTNYKKRLALLKSGLSRFVIRKSANTVMTQVIKFEPDGDKVLVSATSQELKKMGWKAHTGNLPSAYLTGLLLGMKAKKVKVGKVVVDLGLQSPIRGGRIFAALKGAVDAGIQINCGKEALPSDDRVSGKHIADYAVTLKKNNKQKYEQQFSQYLKAGSNPEDLCKLFEATKQKILNS